jgi:hypothetical protein
MMKRIADTLVAPSDSSRVMAVNVTFEPGARTAWHNHPAGQYLNKSGLFKCPPRTPPAPGMHCDSVAGATSHGQGALPEATEEWVP